MEHTDTHAGTGQGASAGDSSDTEVERRLRQAQAAEAMDHEVRLVLLAWKRTAPVSCLADADVALARAVCAHLRSGQSLGMAGTVRRWAVEQSDAAAMVRELSSLRRSVAVLGDPDPVAVDALFDRLSSLAVEQAMTTLHAEARTDVLTSTGNRRAFDDRIEQVLAVSCRRGHPFAVCFVDLDGLKDVNDRLGHRTGDSRLRQTAEAVRSGMRVEDEVFRVGGDEFAVLMPFCTRAEAEAAMVRVAGAGAPAFSYGIAAYPEDGMTAATLIAAADVAMYRGRAARRAPAHVELLAVEMSRPWVTKALVTAMAGLVLMSGVAFARAVARGAPTPAPRASGPTPTLPFPVTAPSQGVAPAGGAPVATGPVSSGPAASAPAPAVTVVRTQPTSVGGSAPGSGSTAVMGLTPATGAPASSTLGTVPVSVPVAVPTPPPSTTPAPSGGLVGSVVGGTVAVVGGTVGGVLGIL